MNARSGALGAIGLGGLAVVGATVIAGVDVLETSFLLLVVASGRVNRRS